MEFWLSIGNWPFWPLGIQILNELQQSLRVEGIEEVRLIKDKRTGMYLIQKFKKLLTPIGQSRQFAFAQFIGIPEAKQFLDKYHPTISLYGAFAPNNAAASEPTQIRIAYSREKDDREKPGKSDDDWKCEVVCSKYI
jgi:RNA-binding protein 5/10